MNNDDIIRKLAEARAYILTVQTHQRELPAERVDSLLEWADRVLRDLSSELEAA